MTDAEQNEGDFKCDQCGKHGTPDEFAYIGPTDEDDTSCTPFILLNGNWKQICWACKGAKTT